MLNDAERIAVAAVGYLMLAVASRGEEVSIPDAIKMLIEHSGVAPTTMSPVRWNAVHDAVEKEICGE